MSHSNSCGNNSSTRMANGRTNGHSGPDEAMCSKNEPVLEKEGMYSVCVKSQTPYKEIDSLTISQTGSSRNSETPEILIDADEESDGAMCSNKEPVLEKEGMDSVCVKSETKDIDSLAISQAGSSCNSETSEILVDADEESDEPDSSAKPKATCRRKYCLFVLTTYSTNKHIISKIKCEDFGKFLREDDELISVNSTTTTTSFSHTEIVNHFITVIEDFYKEQSELVITVKRVQNGITEFITFTFTTTVIEEDGPFSKIFKNLKLLTTKRAFEYINRIPPRIKRLCSYNQKYLKYNGKEISMDVIDGEKNPYFQFLCTEYQVGPVNGLYEYMCCIEDASTKKFLCPCWVNKGVQFKKMQPIQDDIDAKIVEVDERFFFRTESKEAREINYFQSVTRKNYYLAYNGVDGLYLKSCTPERIAQNGSGEFGFNLN